MCPYISKVKGVELEYVTNLYKSKYVYFLILEKTSVITIYLKSNKEVRNLCHFNPTKGKHIFPSVLRRFLDSRNVEYQTHQS